MFIKTPCFVSPSSVSHLILCVVYFECKFFTVISFIKGTSLGWEVLVFNSLIEKKVYVKDMVIGIDAWGMLLELKKKFVCLGGWDMVEECEILLTNISLHIILRIYTRIWDLNLDGISSVKEAYEWISNFEYLTHSLLYNVIWNNLVPLRIFLFDWRLLHKRLPTKDNL